MRSVTEQRKFNSTDSIYRVTIFCLKRGPFAFTRASESLLELFRYRWLNRDDVIKWKHQSRYWPFVTGGFPFQRPVTGDLMFSLICAGTNVCASNRDAGDLRHRCSHFDFTVMISLGNVFNKKFSTSDVWKFWTRWRPMCQNFVWVEWIWTVCFSTMCIITIRETIRWVDCVRNLYGV